MIEYPLHWYVFENDVESLKKQLGKTPKVSEPGSYSRALKFIPESFKTPNCYFYFHLKDELDKKDLRSKTPLELAVVLDHFDCAKMLVEHGADCDVITSQGWNCK